MFTPEEKAEILEAVRLMTSLQKAFPKNDLGDPDFDGHRIDHLRQRAANEKMEMYKVSFAKKVIAVATTFLVGLLASGFVSKLSALGVLP